MRKCPKTEKSDGGFQQATHSFDCLAKTLFVGEDIVGAHWGVLQNDIDGQSSALKISNKNLACN